MKISIGLWLLYQESVTVVSRYRYKNNKIQTCCPNKKYCMHQRLSELFDPVSLQYSSTIRKTHTPSACAYSPATRTANSTLGLKRPTLRP